MTVDFEDRLADLRRRFLLRAASDRIALAQLAVILQQGLPGATTRADIRPIVHKLAGAGGTLGYAGVSASAAEMERRLDADTKLAELAACCHALIREIDQAVAEGAAASSVCRTPETGAEANAIALIPG